MTGVGWFMTIIIGAIAGRFAEKVMKADMGLLMNIIIGILGALLFNWLLSLIMGEALVGWIGSLIAGFIGACILIFLARLVRGKRAGHQAGSDNRDPGPARRGVLRIRPRDATCLPIE